MPKKTHTLRLKVGNLELETSNIQTWVFVYGAKDILFARDSFSGKLNENYCSSLVSIAQKRWGVARVLSCVCLLVYTWHGKGINISYTSIYHIYKRYMYDISTSTLKVLPSWFRYREAIHHPLGFKCRPLFERAGIWYFFQNSLQKFSHSNKNTSAPTCSTRQFIVTGFPPVGHPKR